MSKLIVFNYPIIRDQNNPFIQKSENVKYIDKTQFYDIDDGFFEDVIVIGDRTKN